MSLSLPEDAEPFLPNGESISYLHTGGVYALELVRPDNVAEQWDRYNDTRPDYFERFRDAERVVYIGQSMDVMYRLEQHRDSEIKVATLLKICEIKSLRNIWWVPNADQDRREIEERKMARMLQDERPTWYVHSR